MITQEKIKRALEASDLSQFTFREYEIDKQLCVLCNPIPHPAPGTWNKDNLILRSCIYRKNDYLPISLSLPKFHNLHERPDLDQLPDNINDIKFTEKLDGSLLAISRFNNELIFRTRGAISVTHHNTGDEIIELIKKYKIDVFFTDPLSSDYTLIFEHVTPNNRIIINYDKPDLVLIGGIINSDYTLLNQYSLDYLGKSCSWKRPKIYQFNSVDSALNEISNWKDTEGVVCYYGNNDQKLVKVKALHYLKLHKLKSSLDSMNNLLNVYFEYLNSPMSGDFFHYVSTTTDFEVATYLEKQINYIVAADSKLNGILEKIQKFCNGTWNSQKEFALAAQQEYDPVRIVLAYEIKKSSKKEISAKTRRKWLENELASNAIGPRAVETDEE